VGTSSTSYHSEPFQGFRTESTDSEACGELWEATAHPLYTRGQNVREANPEKLGPL